MYLYLYLYGVQFGPCDFQAIGLWSVGLWNHKYTSRTNQPWGCWLIQIHPKFTLAQMPQVIQKYKKCIKQLHIGVESIVKFFLLDVKKFSISLRRSAEIPLPLLFFYNITFVSCTKNRQILISYYWFWKIGSDSFSLYKFLENFLAPVNSIL